MSSTSTHSPPLSPTSITKERHIFHEHVPVSQDHAGGLEPVLNLTRFGRMRRALREPAAEFLGVAILVMFGCAGGCQAVLSSDTNVANPSKGDWFSVSLGWGFGLGLGAWVAGGVSGGHLNPAVTLALATWRGFPWRKVPGYVFAQLMGGIFGAALVYANYYHAINIFEGGTDVRTLKTAGLFGTYAIDYLPNSAAFFSEFLGTFLLMFVILAATDKRNGPPPVGLLPLVLFLTLFGLGVCFGMQTGFAVNPARDLGPRILTSIAGWGAQVYSFRKQYWLWCTVIAPLLGAQVAVVVYDGLVYTDDDSLLVRVMPLVSRRAKCNSHSASDSV